MFAMCDSKVYLLNFLNLTRCIVSTAICEWRLCFTRIFCSVLQIFLSNTEREYNKSCFYFFFSYIKIDFLNIYLMSFSYCFKKSLRSVWNSLNGWAGYLVGEYTVASYVFCSKPTHSDLRSTWKTHSTRAREGGIGHSDQTSAHCHKCLDFMPENLKIWVCRKKMSLGLLTKFKKFLLRFLRH